MDEMCYLVANMDGLCEESRNEKWLRHWNESCDMMTERYEEINLNQPVTIRKATKEEIEKWASIKKNPFRLGDR